MAISLSRGNFISITIHRTVFARIANLLHELQAIVERRKLDSMICLHFSAHLRTESFNGTHELRLGAVELEIQKIAWHVWSYDVHRMGGQFCQRLLVQHVRSQKPVGSDLRVTDDFLSIEANDRICR
jgi:hypothetical protein